MTDQEQPTIEDITKQLCKMTLDERQENDRLRDALASYRIAIDDYRNELHRLQDILELRKYIIPIPLSENGDE